MLGRDELSAAVRALDDASDAGVDLPTTLASLGIDGQGALYVAEQRALRVGLLFEGWTEEELRLMASGVNPRRVHIDSSIQVLLPTFAAVWLDGLATGRKVSAGS